MIERTDGTRPRGLVGDIFTYPLRGGGKWLLIIGTILGVASDIASFAPLLGIIATFLLTGYFCAIYFDIIQTSATGSDEAPHVPELSNIMEDILAPWIKTLIVGLVCFLPLILFVAFAPESLQLPPWHLA